MTPQAEPLGDISPSTAWRNKREPFDVDWSHSGSLVIREIRMICVILWRFGEITQNFADRSPMSCIGWRTKLEVSWDILALTNDHVTQTSLGKTKIGTIEGVVVDEVSQGTEFLR